MQRQPDSPPYHAPLTIAQCAQRLQVSERTVRRLIAAGRLPAFRIGRLVRIHSRDLRELERPE
ncbi:helix-turn-helix domain-containing protein [Belnapia rosea]|uniref:helix-turn-helix domain-containing protein n=1 Tax=Belnapia rosea TaxID=938405 RepID=UPI000B861A4C